MSCKALQSYGQDSIDRSLFNGSHSIFNVTPIYEPFGYEYFEEIEEKLKVKLEDLIVGKETKSSVPDFYLEPQEEGGFIALSKEYPGAVGQGETVEEALKDLQEATQLLKEVLEEDKTSEKNR